MLTKIRETQCECGAEMQSESRANQHCSGEWNEYRVFKCGKALRYSPNFSRVETTAECERSKDYLKKVDKQKKAKQATLDFIQKLDVNANYAEKLADALKYC